MGGTIQLTALFILAGRLGALVEQTGWVARIVLLILLGFSLFSWALIFQKYLLFSKIEGPTQKLLRLFRANTTSLPDPKSLRVTGEGSPFTAIYDAGYRSLTAQLTPGNPHGKLKNPQMIAVEMQLESGEQVRRMERWMPWLATTGSVTPFIGLFGTVWGVMDSFAGLGTAGAASLRAVAPGIAEALITTAAGLFTAIPAVIAYNHYLNRIRSMASRMDSFAMEFVARVESLNN